MADEQARMEAEMREAAWQKDRLSRFVAPSPVPAAEPAEWVCSKCGIGRAEYESRGAHLPDCTTVPEQGEVELTREAFERREADVSRLAEAVVRVLRPANREIVSWVDPRFAGDIDCCLKTQIADALRALAPSPPADVRGVAEQIARAVKEAMDCGVDPQACISANDYHEQCINVGASAALEILSRQSPVAETPCEGCDFKDALLKRVSTSDGRGIAGTLTDVIEEQRAQLSALRTEHDSWRRLAERLEGEKVALRTAAGALLARIERTAEHARSRSASGVAYFAAEAVKDCESERDALRALLGEEGR